MLFSSGDDDTFGGLAAALRLEAEVMLRETSVWFSDLTVAERTLGVCGFIVFLIALMVNAARHDRDPGSGSRQFSGALFVVVTVAFGLGWSLDHSAGSLSYLFGR